MQVVAQKAMPILQNWASNTGKPGFESSATKMKPDYEVQQVRYSQPSDQVSYAKWHYTSYISTIGRAIHLREDILQQMWSEPMVGDTAAKHQSCSTDLPAPSPCDTEDCPDFFSLDVNNRTGIELVKLAAM